MKLAKEKSLKDIAKLIDVKILGNEDVFIKGINEIHKVEEVYQGNIM